MARWRDASSAARNKASESRDDSNGSSLWLSDQFLGPKLTRRPNTRARLRSSTLHRRDPAKQAPFLRRCGNAPDQIGRNARTCYQTVMSNIPAPRQGGGGRGAGGGGGGGRGGEGGAKKRSRGGRGGGGSRGGRGRQEQPNGGQSFHAPNPQNAAQAPGHHVVRVQQSNSCLLYTSPSPRDQRGSRMPSSA